MWLESLRTIVDDYNLGAGTGARGYRGAKFKEKKKVDGHNSF